MAFFGRESAADRERAERARIWFQGAQPLRRRQPRPGLGGQRGCHHHGAGRRPGHRGDLLRNRGLAGFEPAAGVARPTAVRRMASPLGTVGIILSFSLVWLWVMTHHRVAVVAAPAG